MLISVASTPVTAQEVEKIENFSQSRLVIESAKFLGTTAESMAEIVGRLFAQYGPPSAVLRGEEVSAAIMLGLRYGRGEIEMQDGRREPIYWRGPSAGIDSGGSATKSFALIYGLNNPNDLHKRFVGIEGSAFYVGGVSANFLERDNVIVAPLRVGIGMRLGANIGYVKFSPEQGWFPF
ncbi:DUF1134 domain-containing protein [Alphaproteobacteria bacterium]|nr:DUF1134 domain-containing protein [Alphaproteobacteria bacterium]